MRTMVSVSEAERILARRGVRISRLRLRYLLASGQIGVALHPRAVLLTIERQVLVDGIEAADLDRIEAALRERT